jgi:hypothetical protein
MPSWEGTEVSELGDELSELQEEVRALAQAEEAVRRRKEDAEEALRQTELGFEGDLGRAADRVAALALSKVEEIDAFKARVEWTSVSRRGGHPFSGPRSSPGYAYEITQDPAAPDLPLALMHRSS